MSRVHDLVVIGGGVHGCTTALFAARGGRAHHPDRHSGYCKVDGYANAYLTGLAFRAALLEAGVTLHEHTTAIGIDREAGAYVVKTEGEPVRGRRRLHREAAGGPHPRTRAGAAALPHRQASAATTGKGGMTRFDPERLHGMHAATIVPMTADFRIDEAALARHIAEVAGTPGIHGLLVNGHAGENFMLTSEEKRRVGAVARGGAEELRHLLWRQRRVEPQAGGGCAAGGSRRRGRPARVPSEFLRAVA